MAQDNVSEIKSRLNIVDVVSPYVSLKKQGNAYIGKCPFHAEKTPSFRVDPDKQFYKCFGCGKAGDMFTFIQEKENLSFTEALELLAEKAGVKLIKNPGRPREASEKELIITANSYAETFFSQSLKNADARVISYLTRRGIDSGTVERFGLGWAPEGWNGLLKFLEEKRVSREIALKAGLLSRKEETGTVYDRFRSRIMFPIYDILGRPIGFGGRIISEDKELPKYINSQETPVFSKGREFYALNLAHKEISAKNHAIIVEGYMDVIACHSAGIQNSVALLGTALTEDHVRKLSRYTMNVTLCLDADPAGIKSALRSGEMLMNAGFRVSCAALPPGEDPDSLIRSGGAARFLDFIQNSPGLLEFEIQKAVSRFDTSTKEGRVEALEAAEKIIAREPSGVKRAGLIGDIAFLHPRFNTGINVEEQIGRDVERLAFPKQSGKEALQGYIPDSRTRYDRAQELLLAGVFRHEHDLNEIFDSLGPEDFRKGFFRKLVTLLKSRYDSGGALYYDELMEEIAAKGLEKPFYTMLAETEMLHGSSRELVTIIKEEAALYNADRRQELTEKLKRGELNTSDPEYKELLLLRKSKGFKAK
ncbi:MAG: DNA primase [Abditibacteriota bacterium]|nr:DNA primase [Abditibacteriota bacterium]